MKLKLINILNESKEPVKISRFEERSLYYMCSEKVNPTLNKEVYDFLVHKLFLKEDDEIVKIMKLYYYNFPYDVIMSDECEEIEKSFYLPLDVNYRNEQLALSQWLGINPYLISSVATPSNGDLGEYEDDLDEHTYKVGTADDSRYAARKTINYIIETEGYSYFDSDWISSYVSIVDESAEYDAEQRGKEESKGMTDDSLRNDVDWDAEYDDLKEDKEGEEEELTYRVNKVKKIKFKLENLDKEKKIIEREIETLGFSLDYDVDDDYSNDYGIDISEMTNTLNELETTIYEYNYYIDDTELEIGKIKQNIDDILDEMSEFEGVKLLERWMENFIETVVQEYSDNPMDYVHDSGMYVEEAELEGLIEVDEGSLINDYIYDLGNVFSDYDGVQNITLFNGINYYIFRTH